MRYGILLPVAAATLASLAMPARALPLVTGLVGPDARITQVRDGCGPFGHRSHYGYCKENGDGGYFPGGYGGYGYGYHRGPGFYGNGGYGERRCFIRETYDGPVRVCR